MAMELRGGRELAAALRGMSAKVATRALVDATKAGGEIIAAEAARLAPVLQDAKQGRRRGFLRRNIRARVVRRRRQDVRVAIGFTPAAFYGRFAELGTSRQAATPFLRPAIASRGQEAVNVMAAKLRVFVESLRA